MIKLPISLLCLGLSRSPALLRAITPAELEARFKPLPTVPEDKMPPLSNAPAPFRGLIQHDGLEGHTWVAFPFVENPGSFGFDPQGRLYVAEANRFWLGVPDLRGANETGYQTSELRILVPPQIYPPNSRIRLIYWG